MFNYKLLKVRLYGLVGFLNLVGNGSRSGLDVTDVDPLINQQNLAAVFPVSYPGTDDDQVPAWEQVKPYGLGDVVTVGGNYFRSLMASNTQETTDQVAWGKRTALQLHLEDSYNTAIVRTLQGLMVTTKTGLATTPPLRQQPVINSEAKPNQVLAKGTGRFLGWKIFTDQPDTLLALNRVGLQLGTVQAVTIYVMPESPYGGADTSAVQTITIPPGRSYRTSWADAMSELFLSDRQASTAYYMGYFEDDVEGEIMGYPIDLSKLGSCNNCEARQRQLTTLRKQWVTIQPFSVDNQVVGSPEWDAEEEIYTDEHAFGLNAEVSVSCDLTRLVLEQQVGLATALQYQWAKVLVEQMARSQQQNQAREKLVNPALYLLGNQLNPGGLTRAADKHLANVSLSWSGLSPYCLSQASPQPTIKLNNIYSYRPK